jgi:hypothetical protein
MSNRKQIHKGKSGGAAPLLWLGPFRLRRRLPATFSNGSLEYASNRRLRRRPRRPAVGAEQQHHDELPIRTITAGRISSLVYDRPTTSIL